MRVHKKYRAFAYARETQPVRETVTLRNLSAARLEPVLFGGTRGGLAMDVVFSSNGTRIAVPFVEVFGEMLDQRESSPFVWPAWLAQCVSVDTVNEIEDALLPWIEAQTFNRSIIDEVVRFFGSQSDRLAFERARDFGFAGAAPYRVLFQMVAPYLFAERYSRGKRVHAVDAQGGSGAAMLSQTAAYVRADLGSLEANALAREWFGLDLYGEPHGAADVKIGGSGGAQFHIDLSGVVGMRVPVATPVPLDVLVSFDPEDAPPLRYLSATMPVRELPPVALPRFEAAGGSAGSVLLVVRSDASRAPDADTDAAALLAARLRAEGFRVDVREAPDARPDGYDLVHCCCAAFPEQVLDLARRARELDVPVVLTEQAQSRDGDATWAGIVVPQVLRIASDETILDDHLRMLKGRKLEGIGAVPGQEPFEGYQTAVAHLRELARAVVPADAAPFLPAPRPLAVPAGTPYGDFVLAHAPIRPQSNQVAVVRAAAIAGVPVVLAGTIADVEYLHYVRSFAAHGLVVLPEPDPSEAAGLYAAAKVYIDVGWLRLGKARIALAQAAGCAIVAAPSVDQADENGIADALGRAWEAPRPAPYAPQADPLSFVVQAYSNCAAAGRNT